MIICIIRHFKVDYRSTRKMTSSEFNVSMKEYDTAPIIFPKENPIKENNWDICFTSDLPRAVKTADYICGCEKIQTELLREVPMKAFFKTDRKYSAPFWHVTSRLFWRFSKNNQDENYYGTISRVDKAIEKIFSANKKRVLVVSHGFYLRSFIQHLKKNGFKGNVDTYIRNGKPYYLQRHL